MRIRNQITFFIVVLILLVAIGGISIYTSGMKRLLRYEKTVQATWGDVEWRLDERNQAIEPLLKLARVKVPDQEEIYKEAGDLKEKLSSIMKRGAPRDVIQTENELFRILSGVIAILENALKGTADSEYVKLKRQFNESDGRLVSYEIQYNEAAGRFNKFIRRFPGRFVARGEDPKILFPLPRGSEAREADPR